MIASMCVIIMRPQGEEVSTLGIRTAWANYSGAIDSNILFLEDGVYNALNNRGYNSDLLKDFIKEGGKAYCYQKSLKERGLPTANLMDGIEVISEEEVAELIEEAESTATF
ncbi:MAG: DsrE family protein [Deltaproteobacteria bacterium]|nr:DsrE family protein [Deltaproteobacteria bacterium]MBW2084482.1 DsrE family protein [Deltaproteobacteria bacterium]